jgi:hypothetical protein
MPQLVQCVLMLEGCSDGPAFTWYEIQAILTKRPGVLPEHLTDAAQHKALATAFLLMSRTVQH